MADFKVKTNQIQAKDFLSLREVIPDLKSLPKKFIIFMIFACLVIIFFNFFNVQGADKDQGWDTINSLGQTIHHNGWFLPLSQYHQALHTVTDPITHIAVFDTPSTFGHSKGAAVATAVLYSLNGLASFTGIIAVSMISYNKVSQYFWGVISSIFYGLFAISTGYLGDLIMEAIIVLCCPIGWYLFERAKILGGNEDKKSWKFNLVFFIGAAICIAIVTLVLYEFLPKAFTDTFGKLGSPKDSNNPYIFQQWKQDLGYADGHTAQRVLDSLGNGFNFIGYIMQLANFPEQMYIWMLNDTIKLLKFAKVVPGILSVNMLIQFVVWISLDVVGVYNRLFKEWIDALFLRIKSVFKRK